MQKKALLRHTCENVRQEQFPSAVTLIKMEAEIAVPNEVPVMTLAETVLFPQAIIPLYIYEPRYKQMLRDVLRGDRLFAIANLDEQQAVDTGRFEPPYETATLGIIRACQTNEDGTAQLVLQGLSRVEVVKIVRETPYRMIRIAPLESTPVEEDLDFPSFREEVTYLIEAQRQAGEDIPKHYIDFLATIDNPEVFIDLTAHSFCADPELKQQLLETLDTNKRLEELLSHLWARNERIKLEKELGSDRLDEDDIALN